MKFKQNYEAMKATDNEKRINKVIKHMKTTKPLIFKTGNVMWGTEK